MSPKYWYTAHGPVDQSLTVDYGNIAKSAVAGVKTLLQAPGRLMASNGAQAKQSKEADDVALLRTIAREGLPLERRQSAQDELKRRGLSW